ncbi:MAG: 30S ribosomal protein S12 methylthiotransferase RimO [Elusimicrobia bacterium]|nr:30S ribosomal protein S12 methylthiotransferase RimO [Elusimicrobiota bacterium]
MRKVNIISFGCPKNLVDSETIAGILAKNGCAFLANYNLADIIIINTCAFIESAREEAYSTISEISKQKSPHQKLVVCGCLPQLEKDALLKKFPKIDMLLGSSDFSNILNALNSFDLPSSSFVKIGTPKFVISNEPKIFSTPKSYAYIKIAEGCNNRCNYCIIPALRGNYRSRKIEDILKDAENAAVTGRKEVILIAQDITMYGSDIYKKRCLHTLLKKMVKISGLQWIRLLYTHPAHFTDELISTIAGNEKICKYIDIPIQHTDDSILKQMGRSSSGTIFNTIEKLRKKIPNIVLRTTIMVGFPGETEKIFTKLLNDIKSLEFDWLGGFAYSPQKGTVAFDLKNTIPQKIKEARLNKLMEVQQKITYIKNKARIGKPFNVLVDSDKCGHAEFQAPEIDGNIIFKKRQIIGGFLKVKIKNVKNVYDLTC